jgi:ribosomal protein L30E
MAFDLIKEIKDRKLVFGARAAARQIKKGNVETTYISADCPSAELLGKADTKKLDLTSSEMREICRKPFGVSVIAIMKEEGRSRPKEGISEEDEKKTKKGKPKKSKGSKGKPPKEEEKE